MSYQNTSCKLAMDNVITTWVRAAPGFTANTSLPFCPLKVQSHTSLRLACLLLKYLNCCSCLKGFREPGANKEFFINHVESRNQWSPSVTSFHRGRGGDGGRRNSEGPRAAGRLPSRGAHRPPLLPAAHKRCAEQSLPVSRLPAYGYHDSLARPLVLSHMHTAHRRMLLKKRPAVTFSFQESWPRTQPGKSSGGFKAPRVHPTAESFKLEITWPVLGAGPPSHWAAARGAGAATRQRSKVKALCRLFEPNRYKIAN